MKQLFDRAIDTLIQTDIVLFRAGLHEQTLVARLAHHLQGLLTPETGIENYFVDVEYNRANGGVQKVQVAAANRVFVDLVLHGRGQRGVRENIICAEIKKRYGKTVWTSSINASDYIFPNNQDDTQARQELLRDQNKLISFTTAGDAHNGGGVVEGYELGVLLVPRYEEYMRNGNSLARIPQVFVRYYLNGHYDNTQDRLINIDI